MLSIAISNSFYIIMIFFSYQATKIQYHPFGQTQTEKKLSKLMNKKNPVYYKCIGNQREDMFLAMPIVKRKS